MNYLNQIYYYLFPNQLSFQKLSDTIINISSYLSHSDVCSLILVERYTFSVFTGSQVLAPKFANTIVKEKSVDFVLKQPDYIFNNIRIISNIKFQNSEQLEHLLPKLPQLRQISFFRETPHSAIINNNTIRMLSSYCSGLKVFDLTNLPAEENVLPELVRLTALKTLRLSGCSITHKNSSPFLKHLTQLTNLRFSVEANVLSDIEDLYLYQTNLKKLNFDIKGKSELHNDCLKFITSFNKLKCLNLGLSISKLDPINQLTRLKKIKLSSEYISNDEIQKLTKLINLKKLSLRSSQHISNPACQAICQQFPKLEFLDLSDTNVTDEGINFLIDLKELRILKIDFCNVSSEKIEQLRERGVTVHHNSQ